MKGKLLVALLILSTVIGSLALGSHPRSIANAVDWWKAWAAYSRTNLLPNERGLNVAVLDSAGRSVDTRSFDTYLNPDSGFDRFVEALPPDCWVIIAVRDEASASLSTADLAALISLGGTTALQGRFRSGYVLVGRPRLGLGNGLEATGRGLLHLHLARGDRIGGLALPTGFTIESAGYEAGDIALLQPDTYKYERLWRWLRAALSRA
ncbi:MAG: interleukin-like EMT inducer domain-containing protein [Mycobacterium leprae]